MKVASYFRRKSFADSQLKALKLIIGCRAVKKHIMESGRIVSGELQVPLRYQRQLNVIKRARYLALLPYCDLH
jgi:small subunit ribosomal protein S18